MADAISKIAARASALAGREFGAKDVRLTVLQPAHRISLRAPAASLGALSQALGLPLTAAPKSSASKGKRSVLSNSQVMLHQPLIGGMLQGPATDLGIEAQHMIRLRDRLYKLMAGYTGKSPEQIHRDFDRNKWLFAEESVEYGVADRVLEQAPPAVRRAGEDDAGEDKD